MRRSAWFGWSATVLVLASCAVTACGEDDEGSLIPDYDGGVEGDASRDGSSTTGDGSNSGADGSTPGKDSASEDVFVPVLDAGDAGVDAGDSGVDAGEDADADAGSDSGAGDDDDDAVDAGLEAGDDAGGDADVDAGEDAGSDGGNNGGMCTASLDGFATFVPIEAAGPAGFKVQYGACAEATTTLLGPYATYSLSAEPGDNGYITTTGDATHRTTVTSYLDTDLLIEGPSLYLPANTFASPFDTTKGHLLVILEDDSSDASCPIDGITVSVPGHAEGAVKYLDASGVDQGAAVGTGSGPADAPGFAYVSDLTAGSDVLGATFDNLPPGCSANYFFTVDGRTPLVAGAVSVLNARLTR